MTFLNVIGLLPGGNRWARRQWEARHGLLLAGFFYNNVKAADPGNDRMVLLMTEIQKGARAFLKQEYVWVSGFVVVMAVLIAVLIVPAAAITYVIGAVLSGAAGYAGMTVATMANARTTNAAQDGPGKALPIAFRGGAVMGFSVAGLALLGLMAVYVVFVLALEVDDAFEVVTAYGLGASSIALFSRVGGGIYTKAADVVADLVGKVVHGADSASVSEHHARVDGVVTVPRRLDVVHAAAWQSTRLAGEPRPCRDGVPERRPRGGRPQEPGHHRR